MSRRHFPRTARVNELLREVLAEEVERASQRDERLDLVTITGVEVEPTFHSARVFYTARHDGADDALAAARVRLQRAVGRQVRLRRTPQLSFFVDPGVTSGWRIEGILKEMHEGADEHDDEDGD